MVLIVSLSSRISPLTSTVIFFERSPWATAVVTAAMLCTCEEVARDAHAVIAVLPDAGDALDLGLAAEAASVPTSRATATSAANERSWSTIVLTVLLHLQHLAADVDGDLLREVALGDRRRHLGDVPHLTGQVVRERVDVLGQVRQTPETPSTWAWPPSLPSVPTSSRPASPRRRTSAAGRPSC